jgi:hypothetical protein
MTKKTAINGRITVANKKKQRAKVFRDRASSLRGKWHVE